MLLAMVFLLLGISPQDAAAQADGGFELGGQILSFVDPSIMHTAEMDWMKMQLVWRRGDNTTGAQMIVNHGRTHGFKVLISLKGLKNELSANPSQYYQEYAAFAAQVARLNPEAIEIWNEPNIDQEWPAGQISGTRYTEMLRQAYTAIKAANPNVMVISGAPAPTGYFGGRCATNGCDDKIFIEQMKNAGAANYFDCTGIHYNEGILPPTANSGDPRSHHYTRYYPTMVSTYRTVFPNKPLCFTELGYFTPDGLGRTPAGFEWANNNTLEEHAQWLARAATLSRDGGVVRLMIVWNVNATFTPSNFMAGYAIVRQNGVCRACETLAAAMSNGPNSAPRLVAPADGVITNDTTPLLDWNEVSDATSYRVELDNNSNFSSPERTNSRTNTAYTITPDLNAGTYYWRVRGRNAEGDGPWSMARRIAIDTQPTEAPVLVAPLEGSSSTTDAVRYEIRIGLANPPSAAPLPANTTSYRPTVDLLPGNYYWQVRAFDVAGNASAWSTAMDFVVATPANAVPTINHYTFKQIDLRWTRISWAVAYQVQLDTTATFAKPLIYETTVNGDTRQITTPSLANGIYYWRVRAQREDGRWGAWSAVSRFQVTVVE
jgi:hypothetical protein